MRVLDLFSAAAGGWSLGMHRAGFETIAACESVEWRRILYAQNNPGVPVYDDVCTLTAERLLRDIGELPAVIVGSPPCQDISSANTKGKGVEGERSGLFFEAVRLIGECRPRWFALENSANLRTRGADAVLSALEGIGYACWPLVVRASDIGANHERPRSWLVGCDLGQVTDANRQLSDGWAVQSRSEGQGCGVSSHGTADRDSGRPDGTGSVSGRHGGLGEAGHAAEVGCGQGLPRRHTRATGRADEPACGDAADAAQERYAAWPGNDEGPQREAHGHEPADGPASGGDPDHGRIEPGIADDGCGDGRGTDRPALGQMAIRANDREHPDGPWPLWSLNDLAGRLRMDDGLPARVAGARVAVGGPRGTAAASLIVEAYGDAVVPQIPEAIGRAILRTEAALSAIYGRLAA